MAECFPQLGATKAQNDDDIGYAMNDSNNRSIAETINTAAAEAAIASLCKSLAEATRGGSIAGEKSSDEPLTPSTSKSGLCRLLT